MINTKLHIFHFKLKLNLRRFKTEKNSYDLAKYYILLYKSIQKQLKTVKNVQKRKFQNYNITL